MAGVEDVNHYFRKAARVTKLFSEWSF